MLTIPVNQPWQQGLAVFRAGCYPPKLLSTPCWGFRCRLCPQHKRGNNWSAMGKWILIHKTALTNRQHPIVHGIVWAACGNTFVSRPIRWHQVKSLRGLYPIEWQRTCVALNVHFCGGTGPSIIVQRQQLHRRELRFQQKALYPPHGSNSVCRFRQRITIKVGIRLIIA